MNELKMQMDLNIMMNEMIKIMEQLNIQFIELYIDEKTKRKDKYIAYNEITFKECQRLSEGEKMIKRNTTRIKTDSAGGNKNDNKNIN